jgi:hypothetical protein
MAIDMSGVTTPRRTSGRVPTRKATSTVTQEPESRRDVRYEGLNALGQTGQGLLLVTGFVADAGAVGKFWPGIAHELSNLAETNETIAGVADFLVKTGPYTALITAVLPLAMQIAVNHNMVSPVIGAGLGAVPKDVLEAQMMAEVMQQQAQAMRQQQAARENLAKARQELDDAMAEKPLADVSA